MSTLKPANEADAPLTALPPHNEAAHAAADQNQLQLVTFQVGTEQYGIDILAVQEINRMLPITRVPQSPPYVEGVVNLRGRMIPIVDLRKRFELDAAEPDKDRRIIVVDLDGRTLGFIVDRVDRVLRIDESIIEPSPDSDYVRGVAKLEQGLLILLDLPCLFASTVASATNAPAEDRPNAA